MPLPPEPGNYAAEFIPAMRTDLKPVAITQPEGTSFVVDGHAVTWQKWHFRIGFTPREGLVLHTIGYEDGGRIRPVIYRAALSEMVVPYGDPHPSHNRKNAFDVGEYGIGLMANALELGCDCLGEIRYFDAFLNNSRGEVVRYQNAVCMHEEDTGILWKHFDWRTNQTEVRRSRRLVVSFIATVGNYEYGFYWYFYQDGSIEYEVKLTGIINTGALAAGRDAQVRHDGRAATLRAESPALLQRAPRYDGGRPRQLRLRGPYRRGAAGAGEPARQRLLCRRHAAENGARGAAIDRSAQCALLEDRQPIDAQRPRATRRIQTRAGGECALIRQPPIRSSGSARGSWATISG